MSLDTQKITDFVKNNTEIFIKQVLFQFKSAQHMRVRPGIKYKESFGRMATDALFQAAGCGWNSQGVTQLDKIELEVNRFELKDQVCEDDLTDTYYNLLGKAGSLEDASEFVLEEEFVSEKVAKVQDGIERLVWRGDTTLGVNNKNGQFDGLVKRMKASVPNGRTGNVSAVANVSDQPYVKVTLDALVDLEEGQKVTLDLTPDDYDGTFEIHNVNEAGGVTTFFILATFTATATGTWTEVQDSRIAKTSSVLDDYYSLKDAMPDEFEELEDRKFYLEPKDFNSMVKELNRPGTDGHSHIFIAKPGEAFVIPGDDITIVKVKGLSGAGVRILTFNDNLWFGTDLVNDYEKSNFFYDEGQDVHKFLMKMKGGTQIAQKHFVAFAE